MDREGHPHDGSAIAWEDRPRFFIDTNKFTGKRIFTEDLYTARDAAGGQGDRSSRECTAQDLQQRQIGQKSPGRHRSVGAKVAIRHTRPKEHQRTGT